MKKKITMAVFMAVATMSLASVQAQASPKKLNVQSVALLNVLAAVPGDLADLMKHGNTITEATLDQPSAEYARYRITVQQCQLRGCLGGAVLTIDQMRDLTPGLYPPYQYETKITVIR